MEKLRILQVAPLISPEGEFGGPVRVAVNQTKALLELGHDVTLVAGTRGFSQTPTNFGGVDVRLFPARILLPGGGYAGLCAPRALSWLFMARSQFDAVHVHMARDFLTLPLARMAQALGINTFVQSHGMIDPSERALARPLDFALTRPVLRRASQVFHLTATEAQGLASVAGPNLRLQQLNNGVPFFRDVTSSRPGREVLYVARLHERKRPLDFVHMALALRNAHPDVKFTLIGPDEGEGPAVQSLLSSAGDPKSVSWEGPLTPDSILPRINRATLYVQPSIHETFPMSVLEAMSTGTPVVLRSSCGLASAVDDTGSGVVVDLSMKDLISAVDRLLRNTAELETLGANARRAANSRFGMLAIARQLEHAYRT